jgi:hypothetical protein
MDLFLERFMKWTAFRQKVIIFTGNASELKSNNMSVCPLVCLDIQLVGRDNMRMKGIMELGKICSIRQAWLRVVRSFS